jgi:hypothetical protein
MARAAAVALNVPLNLSGTIKTRNRKELFAFVLSFAIIVAV